MSEVYRKKKRDYSKRVRPSDYREKFNAYLRRRRAQQNKYKPRHWHPYTDEESVLIGIWSADNVPTKVQAERLGRTPKAIAQVRWKWGLDAPQRGKRKEQ
jgi:hypothetical protein